MVQPPLKMLRLDARDGDIRPLNGYMDLSDVLFSSLVLAVHARTCSNAVLNQRGSHKQVPPAVWRRATRFLTLTSLFP